MSAVQPLKIVGLRDLQRALKALDGESQKQIRVALNSVAEGVAAGAARRVPVRSGKARASLRAQSSQREARVIGGSKKVPYYGWLEFGGKVGPGKGAHRRYVSGGRYIYPAYAANRDGIYKALDAAMAALIRDAGLEVTDGG